MAQCRACHAEILWLRFADTGKSIAVNYTPAVRGNIEIRPDGAHAVKGDPVTVRYWPHVATCPEVRRRRNLAAKQRENEKERNKRAQLKLF